MVFQMISTADDLTAMGAQTDVPAQASLAGPPAPLGGEESATRRERQLNHALAASFPASDPVSSLRFD